MSETVEANTSSKALKRSAKPQLVKVGETGRELSTHGWRDALAIDYIVRAVVVDPVTKLGHSRTVTVAELSRVFYGQNTPTGKERVRRRIPGIATKLLMGMNRMLLSEPEGPRNRCLAVKIFDPESPKDLQLLSQKVEAFGKQYKWSSEKMEKACAILAQFQNTH